MRGRRAAGGQPEGEGALVEIGQGGAVFVQPGQEVDRGVDPVLGVAGRGARAAAMVGASV
ncbi:hypothetical protein [Protofrankia coriariae]|uniref:Uncharacterized protein n=1 Tax=Protofrankia coriariae TaxID=1562887 RepID=A0ABR5F6Y4_9ACTN|nr:hypothetical protein [Protofrankia coriariae]KLL12435.1 hypothetical protein FrCorBMG51_03775 [Protofrankia coriariae]